MLTGGHSLTEAVREFSKSLWNLLVLWVDIGNAKEVSTRGWPNSSLLMNMAMKRRNYGIREARYLINPSWGQSLSGDYPATSTGWTRQLPPIIDSVPESTQTGPLYVQTSLRECLLTCNRHKSDDCLKSDQLVWWLRQLRLDNFPGCFWVRVTGCRNTANGCPPQFWLAARQSATNWDTANHFDTH